MLKLERSYVDQMIAHAQEEDPDECCGIIAGDSKGATKLYRITNAQKSPYRYSMDPREFGMAYQEIERNGWEILVLYHSHTHSPAQPSDTDVRLATGPDGKSLWPDVYYVLVSLEDKSNPHARAFTITDGQVKEYQLEVV